MWEGRRLITIEWAGVGQEGETVNALNDPKYVFVCLLSLPGFLGQRVDRHLSRFDQGGYHRVHRSQERG
jgi:hypothetical protein